MGCATDGAVELVCPRECRGYVYVYVGHAATGHGGGQGGRGGYRSVQPRHTVHQTGGSQERLAPRGAHALGNCSGPSSRLLRVRAVTRDGEFASPGPFAGRATGTVARAPVADADFACLDRQMGEGKASSRRLVSLGHGM